MANELEVEANGLRSGAAASEAIAATQAGGDSAGTAVAQPSGAGVSALNAALTSLKSRQSTRLTEQADNVFISAAVYERTDADGSDSIASVSV